MKPMRSVSTIVLVGMWLGGISACSSVLMNTPVSKSADGWALTLGQVKVGPDEYAGEGGVLVSAGDGQKLIWTLLTVRNESGQEQTFSYETCILAGKGGAYQPTVVDRHEGENSAADRAESFDPGQERTRLLVYTYPKDQRPTLMRCGAIALPIQRSR
jgi:hypothetical protein